MHTERANEASLLLAGMSRIELPTVEPAISSEAENLRSTVGTGVGAVLPSEIADPQGGQLHVQKESSAYMNMASQPQRRKKGGSGTIADVGQNQEDWHLDFLPSDGRNKDESGEKAPRQRRSGARTILEDPQGGADTNPGLEAWQKEATHPGDDMWKPTPTQRKRLARAPGISTPSNVRVRRPPENGLSDHYSAVRRRGMQRRQAQMRDRNSMPVKPVSAPPAVVRAPAWKKPLEAIKNFLKRLAFWRK